jgi:hypothetical protein
MLGYTIVEVWSILSTVISLISIGLFVVMMRELTRIAYHLHAFCQAADMFEELIQELQDALDEEQDSFTVLTLFIWSTVDYAFKNKLRSTAHPQQNSECTQGATCQRQSLSSRFKEKVASKIANSTKKQITPELQSKTATGYRPWFNLECSDSTPYSHRRKLEASSELKVHAFMILNSWLMHCSATVTYYFCYKLLEYKSHLPSSLVVLLQIILRFVLDYQATCILFTRNMSCPR